MSQIVFGRDTVQLISLDINKSLSKLSTCQAQLSSTARSLESSVAARRNVSSRMHGAGRKLSILENKYRSLSVFLQQAATEYGKTEDYLNERAGAVGQLNNTKSILDLLNNSYVELLAESRYLVPLRNSALLLGASLFDSQKLLMAAPGLKFKLFKENGNSFIKVINGNGNINYKTYRDLLTEFLGGTSKKWDRNLMEKISGKGLLLYGVKNIKNGNPIIGFTNASSKFTTTAFEGLNEAVGNLSDSRWTAIKKSSYAALKDSLPHQSFIDWKGASNLTKLGKGMGIVGSGLTVADNVYSNFYDSDTSSWKSFNYEDFKNTSVDTIVDVGAGIGAAVSGAAIGTALVPIPPIGTVVGAVAGAVIYAGLNVKIFGSNPPKSIVDVTKEGAKAAVNWAEKQLGKLFW